MAAVPASTAHVSATTSAHANVTATAVSAAAGESLGLCSQFLCVAWRSNGQWGCNRQNGRHQYWFETKHIRNSMSDSNLGCHSRTKRGDRWRVPQRGFWNVPSPEQASITTKND
jgi:hypothetical protein